MTTRLETLNSLRAMFQLAPLKGWKESKDKLELAIRKLEERSAFEATQQATRQEIADASNKAIVDAVAANPELAAIVKPTKKNAPAAKASFSAAAIIAEFGINAKVGRALLRKHNVAKTPAAVRAFFKARKK